ncbi:nucleotidyltransferase domain-containing protein [Methanobrevibacter filiformis]|uniref:protein adenylyltransferase n=1 Tax=Methanobrevibacter filiformis TaxID=55758 RepID=A0A165ZE34_9EURY|nr:nucleotidyltransferase domain-containing protein [Methanobrevibacter filiformis]KZX10601.1 nucleotidyltransferase domain protein [Methanobrevibacter filiformis]
MNRKEIAIDFANSLNHPEIEKIILFGSVARGDDTEDSDIDVIIFVANERDEFKINDDVYTKVMDIVCNNMEYISAKIININHYNKYKHNAFYSNVDKEGVILA